MPMTYVHPKGPRRFEFWVSGRGGERSEVVGVPEDWSIDDVREELEDWRSRYFTSSELVRYGFNAEGNFGNRQ